MPLKTVDIKMLAECDDVDLRSVFAMNQNWREGQSFFMKNPRQQSALLWFCGCSGVFCSSEGEDVAAPRNSLVYIPEGSRYEVKFFGCEDTPSTQLVEFCLDDGERFVLFENITVIESDLTDGRVIMLIKKLVSEYSLPSKPVLKLKRDLFGLLSLISESEKSKHIHKKGFETIAKGIEYLQKDERQELSIDEIAKMCFVTPAYFRRLFREFSGMSPSDYRTERRVERAKELMEHSELSVEAVSELLGYSDPSYFCRVFKKVMGMSPSEYKKMIEKERS